MIRVKPTKRTGALPTGELTRRMESYGGRKIKFPEPLYLRNSCGKNALKPNEHGTITLGRRKR